MRTAPYFDAFFCALTLSFHEFIYVYFSVVQKCLPKMIWQFPGSLTKAICTIYGMAICTRVAADLIDISLVTNSPS